jgi:uncharacterized membrane protein YphA (DoxX/SURF4 family)
MSSPAFRAPSPQPRSKGNDLVLLGLRLLVVADLVRLGLWRWTAFDLSVRTLEIEGFPAPRVWLVVALLAGGIACMTLLAGWRERWGAALALLCFMPVIAVFSVSYTPTGWPAWIGALLPLAAMTEILLLGLGLMGLFLLGAGKYTLAHGLQAVRRVLSVQLYQSSFEQLPARSEKETAQQ